MTFEKDGKAIQWGKNLQEMMPEQVDIHIQKNKIGPFPYNRYKNELKMITDLNVRGKNRKTFIREFRNKSPVELGSSLVELEKLFPNHISDEGFVSRIYKVLL